MARNLREVIAAVSAERRAKIVVAYRQKLIAVFRLSPPWSGCLPLSLRVTSN
jgi:hypothetical protein